MRKFYTLTKVFYAYMLEYRAEIVIWMLAGILPFILMGVWMKVAQSGGMEPVEFARYFLAVFITHELVVVWVIWEFESHVVNGMLSPYLLQPLDPFWRYVALHVSERLARFPFMVILVLLFFMLYPKAFWIPDASRLSLYIFVVILVFLLRFLIQYTLSFLAFWVERVSQFENLMFAIYMFLSGYFAPISMFPDTIRNFAKFTPFPYMIHLPVSIITGKDFNPLDLVILTLWLILFWVLNRILWRIGLKRYSAMGA